MVYQNYNRTESQKTENEKKLLEKDVLVGLSKRMTTERIKMNCTLKNFCNHIENFAK